MTHEVPESVKPLAHPLFLGIDVGGTTIKLGVVDNVGHSLAHTRIPTDEKTGPKDAVRRARQAVDAMLQPLGLKVMELAGIGLATPGTMDLQQGIFLQPHNLPHWHFFPIRQCVADTFDLPTAFANDANAAAYGEFWVGSGKRFHSIVMLTLGTGVGGGIIIGDLSIDGENSHGSECGHIILDPSPTARMCGCGQRGHLEAYCSATALVQRALEQIAAGRKSSLIKYTAGTDAPLSGLAIAEAALAGDGLANELIDELATWLGLGCVSLMHMVDPGAVILGGAMNFGGHESPVGQRFLEKVRETVRKHAFPFLAGKTTIDFAALGPSAGYIGAAGIARLDYHRKARA